VSRGVAALCTVVALVVGCVAPRRPDVGTAATPQAVVAALAARERATRGLRLSMTVRLVGTEHASVLPSPAYLAIDDAGAIRLQVLSAFGMTVLDLTIRDGGYTLSLPLRQQTTQGTIDPATLADPAVAVSDRMIVALALLFQPKARPDACSGRGATIVCRVAPALRARVTVDDQLRPVREEYVRDDGTSLLVATYEGYMRDDPHAAPTDLHIADPTSGAGMAIHVQRARLASAPRA